MITLRMRCWLWARKRLVRPGPACVQPSWGVFVRGNLPREAVGRTLGGHEPAKTPFLSPAESAGRRRGATEAVSWLVAPGGADRDIGLPLAAFRSFFSLDEISVLRFSFRFRRFLYLSFRFPQIAAIVYIELLRIR